MKREEKRENLDLILIESFKKLMTEYPFEKITVTLISEKAGILRPVFYSYFRDKYELVDYMFYNDITKELKVLLSHGMVIEAIKLLFTHVANERSMYRKLFDTEGQNNFQTIVMDQLSALFDVYVNAFDSHSLPDNPLITPSSICRYYAMGLTISIKNFLASPANATIDQCVNAYYYIVTHSIFDFLSKETTDEFPKV